MAYACDIRQSLIRDPETLAVLRGWYGCEKTRAATAKKESEYRQAPPDKSASFIGWL